MYEGYLELGGGEVLNNARSVGYTETADCPVAWLQCPPCDGIREANGHEVYTFANIEDAPWYDYEDEVTHRFLGAFGLSIEGLPDSTREASVAEGIQDGGVVGRVRHATRRMRVTAVLSAIGEDALEAGFAWLDAALRPGRCGTHGDACGAADQRFYVACPPETSDITKPDTVWNDAVTNVVLNPSMEASSNTIEIARNYALNPRSIATGTALQASTGGTASFITNYPGEIATAGRFTQTVDGVGLYGPAMGASLPLNTPFTMHLKVRASAPISGVTMRQRPAGAASTSGEVTFTDGVPTSLPAGETTITFSGVTSATPPVAANMIGIRWADGLVGLTVDITEVSVISGPSPLPYFDGSSTDTDEFDFAWTSAINASPSTVRAPTVENVPALSSVTTWRSVAGAAVGPHLARHRVTTTGAAGAAGIPLWGVTVPAGDAYTMIGRVRPTTQDQVFIPRIQNANGPAFEAPVGVWTEFRATIIAGTGGATQSGLLMSAGSGHKQGDLIDIDGVSLVAGTYGGAYFDGSLPDSTTAEYEWLGAANASASTYRTGNVTQVPDPEAYALAVEKLTRTMHTVTCVGGPIVSQKLHRGNTWGYIVEFVLVAAVPFIFSVTRPVNLEPSLPIVVQDVPFNLVPFPSAEVALGTVIAATSYSDNPSVEVNLTSWAKAGTAPAATVVLSQADTAAGGIASVGTKSAKARMTATAASAGVTTVALENTSATFSARVAGDRMSVNMWGSAQVVSGTAVLAPSEIYAIWRAGTTVLRTDLIGALPVGGGAVSLKSIAVPVGATNVIMRAQANLTSYASGAVVDLYADAVTVSVP